MGREDAVGDVLVGSEVMGAGLHAQMISEKPTAKRSARISFKKASFLDDGIHKLFYSLPLYKLVIFITSPY